MGSGQLGVNQTIITNNNLFSVGGGGGLDIDVSGGNGGVGVGNGVGTNTASGLLNNGVIQATGASTLSFESGLYENAVGGVIQALAGSTINLNNDSRILNGALTSDATSIINAHNASQYLTNVTLTAGSVIDVNNDDLRLNTVFTNNGTLRISNASRLIDETGALTINGAGTIILDNSGNYAQLFGGTITFGAGQTVQGAGQLGVNQTIFVINNVFSANAGTTLSIDVAGGSGGVGAGNGVGANLNSGLLNNSTIQATGGSILSFESGLYENAANGVIQALSGSTVNLNNDARILNGFLTSVGSGVINAHGVSQYLTNVTLTAGSLLDVNNDDLRLNTSFVNNGTLRIANGSRLIDETGALTITGTGTIVLDNSANYAQIFGGQITFGSGQTIVGSGQLGVNQTIITNNNLFSVGGGGGLDIDVSGGKRRGRRRQRRRNQHRLGPAQQRRHPGHRRQHPLLRERPLRERRRWRHPGSRRLHDQPQQRLPHPERRTDIRRHQHHQRPQRQPVPHQRHVDRRQRHRRQQRRPSPQHRLHQQRHAADLQRQPTDR